MDYTIEKLQRDVYDLDNVVRHLNHIDNRLGQDGLSPEHIARIQVLAARANAEKAAAIIREEVCRMVGGRTPSEPFVSRVFFEEVCKSCDELSTAAIDRLTAALVGWGYDPDASRKAAEEFIASRRRIYEEWEDPEPERAVRVSVPGTMTLGEFQAMYEEIRDALDRDDTDDNGVLVWDGGERRIELDGDDDPEAILGILQAHGLDGRVER